MIDRFANGDPNNDFNVEPSVPGKLPRRRLAGRDRPARLPRRTLGVTALWISPVVKNVEEDAGFAQLPRLLDAGLPAPERSLRRPRRSCASWSTRRTSKGMLVILDVVTNHMGQLFYYDINGNGQPDDTLFGGGFSHTLPADLRAEPDRSAAPTS